MKMNGMNKEENHRMKESARLYQKGIISLQEAATSAKVPLYAMIEYVQKENIRPPSQTREEFEKELKNAEEIFHKLKEEK